MTKELEKLSALYDGEINKGDFQENIARLNKDPQLKKTFNRYGLISDLVQRNAKKQESKVILLSNYFTRLHPMATNAITAAAQPGRARAAARAKARAAARAARAAAAPQAI